MVLQKKDSSVVKDTISLFFGNRTERVRNNIVPACDDCTMGTSEDQDSKNEPGTVNAVASETKTVPTIILMPQSLSCFNGTTTQGFIQREKKGKNMYVMKKGPITKVFLLTFK